jgi:antirestriction protein ArdC
MRVRKPDTRDELDDEFLTTTRADVRKGVGEAHFAPDKGFISIPAFTAFKGADHFYGVVFHELVHRIGHQSRLDHDLKDRFSSKAYAAGRAYR